MSPIEKKFISFLVRQGKKTKAFRILAATLEELGYAGPTQLKQTILEIKPYFNNRKIRIAGVNHQVPAILPIKRQESIAIRWLIDGAKIKHRREPKISFSRHLAQEIRDSSQKDSYASKKRNQLIKQVEANRGFAKYRWW